MRLKEAALCFAGRMTYVRDFVGRMTIVLPRWYAAKALPNPFDFLFDSIGRIGWPPCFWNFLPRFTQVSDRFADGRLNLSGRVPVISFKGTLSFEVPKISR